MSQSPSVNLIGWTLHSGLFMRHIIYPTQNIVEGCVMAIFPEWELARKKRWGINNPHFICLVNELNMINPDYVILMGNEAQAKFKGKRFKNKLWNHNIQEICVPHPSRAANGTWAKILCKCNPTTKANYIVENIP